MIEIPPPIVVTFEAEMLDEFEIVNWPAAVVADTLINFNPDNVELLAEESVQIAAAVLVITLLEIETLFPSVKDTGDEVYAVCWPMQVFVSVTPRHSSVVMMPPSSTESVNVTKTDEPIDWLIPQSIEVLEHEIIGPVVD